MWSFESGQKSHLGPEKGEFLQVVRQSVTLQQYTAVAQLPLTQVLFLQLWLQKLLLLPFDRSKKYCLQPEILTIKVSHKSGHFLVHFYTFAFFSGFHRFLFSKIGLFRSNSPHFASLRSGGYNKQQRCPVQRTIDETLRPAIKMLLFSNEDRFLSLVKIMIISIAENKRLNVEAGAMYECPD